VPRDQEVNGSGENVLFLSLGRKPREAQMACPIRDIDSFETCLRTSGHAEGMLP
jgi:hypothetical protein